MLKFIRNIYDRIVQTNKRIQEKAILKKEALLRASEIKRINRVRNTNKPGYTHCQNCGEELNGMYCHSCGQYASDINESFFKMIRHYLDSSFSYDGRLWVTLKLLFFRPGQLPVEYSKGRIVSYMHPFKMYMFCSFIFFFLFFSFTMENIKVAEKKQFEKNNNITIQQTTNNNSNTAQINVEGLETLKKLNDKFLPLFKTYAPVAMFFLMPIFAVLLMIFFRKSGQQYMNHLIFSINIHTVFLIILSLGIVFTALNDYFNQQSYFNINTIVFAVLSSYLLLATKKYYYNKWLKTFIKTSLAMMIYTILIFVIFVVVLVLGIKMM